MRTEDTLQRIIELDAVIHNPARLMIILLLIRDNKLDYTHLMHETQLTSGNITTHLNKLLDSGYIQMTKSFIGKRPNTAVELTPTGFAAYRKWAENIVIALPQDLRIQPKSQPNRSNLLWKKYPLCLTDMNYSTLEKPHFFGFPEHCLRSHDLRPLDESQQW